MSFFKSAIVTLSGALLLTSQAFAGGVGSACAETQTCSAVPEIDGGGAIIAIGLVVGLVALIREKFYRG